MPISCHFRGCKAPLSSTVGGAISSELAFTFQEARETEQLLTSETPDFIAPALWPERRLLVMSDISTDVHFDSHMSVRLHIVDT